MERFISLRMSSRLMPATSGCGLDHVTSVLDATVTRLADRMVDEAQYG